MVFMVSLGIVFSEGIRILIHELLSASMPGATNQLTPLTSARRLGIFVLLIKRIKF